MPGATSATPYAYPPIEDHGIVGDLRTAALTAANGDITWFCTPRFDAPSLFGALLDCHNGGRWTIRPDSWADPEPGARLASRQMYLPDTNVLITRFFAETGVVEVTDFMPLGTEGPTLVRAVTGVRGEVPISAVIDPRPDYGRRPAEITAVEGGAVIAGADHGSWLLRASVPVTVAAPGRSGGPDVPTIRWSDTLHVGDSAHFCLEHALGPVQPRPYSHVEFVDAFDETVDYWRRWLAKSRYTGRWREMVHRSALLLKLLTYAPTGAIVAAPTTSLPEELGGVRNWDYRYTWIRDAAFTLYALLRLGFPEEASQFMDWLSERLAEGDGGPVGPLQPFYRVDGKTDLEEIVLDHWEGYQGSAPVRIGNAAHGQLQLDTYGEIIDSVYLANKYGDPIHSGTWDDVRRLLDWLDRNWDQPDDSIWEPRGERQRYTYSTLMTWVAFERAVRMARQRGLPADTGAWSRTRDAAYDWIMRMAWNPDVPGFTQHDKTTALDASLLLMPLVHFVAPADPKFRATLDAIGSELVTDSLVSRYDLSQVDDGLPGQEGTFSMCTFWYAEAMARSGRVAEGRLVFEKMLTYASPLGLFSEEIGPTGELLGNYPQAFTHLSLISAAFNLDRALNR